MKLGLVALPAAFLLAMAVFTGACSDSSDALTLEEYFAEFEAIDADIDAQFEEVFAELFPEDFSEEEFFADDANLPALKELLAEFPSITGDAVDRTKALDPPSEVETEHDNLVAAGEDLLVAFEEGNDALQEAATLAEFEALNDEFEPAIDAAQTRVDEACLDVVAVGEANGITVDVTCEDDE